MAATQIHDEQQCEELQNDQSEDGDGGRGQLGDQQRADHDLDPRNNRQYGRRRTEFATLRNPGLSHANLARSGRTHDETESDRRDEAKSVHGSGRGHVDLGDLAAEKDHGVTDVGRMLHRLHAPFHEQVIPGFHRCFDRAVDPADHTGKDG